MTTDQSARVAPGVDHAVLRLQWMVVGLLVLFGGLTTKLLFTGGPPGASEPLSYWLGGAVGQTLMIAMIPAIVAVFTRFRRPWVVLTVWVPIAAFFLLGAIGSREIREGKLDRPMPATAVHPASARSVAQPCDLAKMPSGEYVCWNQMPLARPADTPEK